MISNPAGYAPGPDLVRTGTTCDPPTAFPSLGAVTAHEAPKLAGYQDVSLPTYIGVGGAAEGPGFLGMNYAPFTVQNPGTPPENIRAPQSLGTTAEDINDRVPHLGNTLPGSTEAERAVKLAERAKFADASKAHRDIYYKGFSLVAS